MNDFKAYASRALNAAGMDAPGRKRWSRHGSTHNLNNEGGVAGAVDYVLRRQGEPMTVYDASKDKPRP